jgi:hypothetical protein
MLAEPEGSVSVAASWIEQAREWVGQRCPRTVRDLPNRAMVDGHLRIGATT